MENPPAVSAGSDEAPVHIRTFLIADIRGYTAFTRERGDEAAAALSSLFAQLTREVVDAHAGQLIELRGDEALVVFSSARQALRAAVALQLRYGHQAEVEPDLPLRVGIGVDAGEAVPVEQGYRGAALNMAARLCSAAGPGEILATEAVSHLAGTIADLRYVERRVRAKGMPERVRAVLVTSPELDQLTPALMVARQTGETPFDPSSTDFGDRINAMVQEHIAGLNERLSESLEDMPLKRFEHRPPRADHAAVPVPPATAPIIDQAEEDQSLQLRLLTGVIVLAIVAAGILLWLHFH